MQLVTDATPTGAHGGYHCDVCDCTLKDSTAYLDHINGKRHQRKLGYSMRVEKSSVDAVRARLAAAKQTQHGQKCAADEEAARREALQEYEQRIAEQEEEERRRRKRARTEGQHDAGISSRPVAAASNDAAPPAAANGQWKSDSTSTSGGGHGGTGAQGDAHAGAGAGAAPKQQQPAQAAPLPETVLQGDEAAEMAALLGFSGFT